MAGGGRGEWELGNQESFREILNEETKRLKNLNMTCHFARTKVQSFSDQLTKAVQKSTLKTLEDIAVYEKKEMDKAINTIEKINRLNSR
ncbi:hypothetical protein DPMN_060140 [Dreissena polymorpha]|uniref:Uncharacterized protein n=1 Tax=Dreissena polymorpha TaxID=45954 RepID=A0A9D4C567_DREPO|nr:hypothetical protein DPMN_060140 [Dreissena polymorpha]